MAEASKSDFEKMTIEEAFARYRDLMQILHRLKEFAANNDTCGVCRAKPGVMKAGYYNDGMSGGLLRAMCEPCRAGNLQRAQAAIHKGTDYTHHHSPWHSAKM